MNISCFSCSYLSFASKLSFIVVILRDDFYLLESKWNRGSRRAEESMFMKTQKFTNFFPSVFSSGTEKEKIEKKNVYGIIVCERFERMIHVRFANIFTTSEEIWNFLASVSFRISTSSGFLCSEKSHECLIIRETRSLHLLPLARSDNEGKLREHKSR